MIKTGLEKIGPQSMIFNTDLPPIVFGHQGGWVLDLWDTQGMKSQKNYLEITSMFQLGLNLDFDG